MAEPAPDEEVEAIGRLGIALLDAGYAVTDVSRIAKAVARSNSAEFTLGALPTGVFVDDGDTRGVVTPVLQALQTAHQYFDALVVSDVTHNSAHES